MRRVLIGILDVVNVVLAVLIIGAGTLIGFLLGTLSPVGTAYVEPGAELFIFPLAGFVAGVIVAAITCGFLAAILDIHRILVRLEAMQLATQGPLAPGNRQGPMSPTQRREPTIGSEG